MRETETDRQRQTDRQTNRQTELTQGRWTRLWRGGFVGFLVVVFGALPSPPLPPTRKTKTKMDLMAETVRPTETERYKERQEELKREGRRDKVSQGLWRPKKEETDRMTGTVRQTETQSKEIEREIWFTPLAR